MHAIARFIKTTLVLAVIAIGGAIAYAYSGFYDISVGAGHNAVTHWYLATLREQSIERRAAELQVPSLDDSEMIRAGAVSYEQSCAGCHGRPGRAPSSSWNPRPPALTRYESDPASVFWVVRNGIKMSAMPARSEERMPDEQIWEVAAFMQVAPRLTEGEYREMVEPPPPPEVEPVPAPDQPEPAQIDDESGDETVDDNNSPSSNSDPDSEGDAEPADQEPEEQPATDEDNDN